MINKEIAKTNATEQAVYQVFFVLIAVLGALFLIGWGIPWLSDQKSTIALFFAPVGIVAYVLAFMLMAKKVFSKPKVEIDRTNEPELHETDR